MYRKRERTQNWSLEEKKYLLDLVKSRLEVLENKRIDSASSAMKGMAWQDIHASFAARFGNDRDAHRVREQWRRMKGQARTEMLEFADRVRSHGAEVANQRWPSALAEDVWKTLEAARNINDYHHGYGGADDVGSPVVLDEDEDDDVDEEEDEEDGEDVGGGARGHDRMAMNGIKTEPEDRNNDPLDFHQHDRRHHNHHHLHNHHHDGGDGMEIVDLLLPKVEMNDGGVPDLDTSMVPSGLSITAVRIGSGSQKRRAVDRRDHHARHNWDFTRMPAALQTPTAGPHAPGVAPVMRSATPQQQQQQQQPQGAGAANCQSTPADRVQEGRGLEQRRRLQFQEAEHLARMDLLRLERQTAEARLRIALRDEVDVEAKTSASTALTCRSCGAGRGQQQQQQQLSCDAKRLGAASPPTVKNENSDPSVLNDNTNTDADVSTANSEAIQRRLGSPTASDDADGGGGSATTVNGIKDQDDDDDDDDNNNGQVRFAGGLGEPGSGAGKGGGSGGSIRDAGGSMGKREVAYEEEYFYKQQREQLKKLKAGLTDEIGFHEEQIKRHQEAITRHKLRVHELDKEK